MKEILIKIKNKDNIFVNQIKYKNQDEYETLVNKLNLSKDEKEIDIDDLFNILIDFRKKYDIEEIKNDIENEIKEKNKIKIINNMLKASYTYYKQIDFLLYFISPIAKIENEKILLINDYKAYMRLIEVTA